MTVLLPSGGCVLCLLLLLQLCDLYENDSIFDKFECTISGGSDNVATGSYSNYFRVFNVATGHESTLEASKTPQVLTRTLPPACFVGL